MQCGDFIFCLRRARGRDLIDLEWVPFYEIRLPGDSATTRFCEDCMGWLIEAADHIRTS